MATFAPWSCMLFSQTASVPLIVSPIMASRLTGPGLVGAQLVDDIHPPLVGVGLPLALQIARLDVGQFAVLLLRQPHLRFDRFLLVVEPVPVARR